MAARPRFCPTASVTAPIQRSPSRSATRRNSLPWVPKRIAARPGDRVPYAEGYLILGDDEAWLLSDANDAELMAAGLGEPVDSRRYGPVPVELLIGRAWFRYAPIRRIGRFPRPSGNGD